MHFSTMHRYGTPALQLCIKGFDFSPGISEYRKGIEAVEGQYGAPLLLMHVIKRQTDMPFTVTLHHQLYAMKRGGIV